MENKNIKMLVDDQMHDSQIDSEVFIQLQYNKERDTYHLVVLKNNQWGCPFHSSIQFMADEFKEICSNFNVKKKNVKDLYQLYNRIADNHQYSVEDDLFGFNPVSPQSHCGESYMEDSASEIKIASSIVKLLIKNSSDEVKENLEIIKEKLNAISYCIKESVGIFSDVENLKATMNEIRCEKYGDEL